MHTDSSAFVGRPGYIIFAGVALPQRLGLRRFSSSKQPSGRKVNSPSKAHRFLINTSTNALAIQMHVSPQSRSLIAGGFVSAWIMCAFPSPPVSLFKLNFMLHEWATALFWDSHRFTISVLKFTAFNGDMHLSVVGFFPSSLDLECQI